MVEKIDLSILIPARKSEHCLEKSVKMLTDYFSHALPLLKYELILIPNPDPRQNDKTLDIAKDLEARFASVKVVYHPGVQGKGAALKAGHEVSNGAAVLMVDADLPFELDFIAQSLSLMNQGSAFVTANRRMKESQFVCPVPLLPLVYRRHKVGLWFNWAVRRLFSIGTLDTQAGMKMMTQALADKAFSLQTCPTFFADIEYFLVAKSLGMPTVETPVVFHLKDEKSTIRLAREVFLSVYWLSKIWFQNLMGFYDPKKSYRKARWQALKTAISGHYQDEIISRFAVLNSFRIPYESLGRYVPWRGMVGVEGLEKNAAKLFFQEQSPKRVLPEKETEGLDCGVLFRKSTHETARFQSEVQRFSQGIREKALFLLLEEGQPQQGPSLLNRIEYLEKMGFQVMVEKVTKPFFSGVLYVCRKDSKENRVSFPYAWVTADDWGLSPGINEGILNLAKKGVVRRVSMMAEAPFLDHGLEALKNIPGIQLGLHFDLTSPHQKNFSSKLQLLGFLFSPFKKGKVSFLQKTLEEQLSRLEKRGLQIQYLDGHHHVHLLPYVCESISQPLQRRKIRYVRLPKSQALWFTSKWLLNLMSLFAERSLRKSGFNYWPCYYPSLKDFEDPARLAYLLSTSGEKEVIVHPAEFDDLSKLGIKDSYQKERVIEYQSLMKVFPLG